MNIGEMKHKIKVYMPSFAVDDVLGTDEPEDTLLCSVWAKISPRTGSMLMGRDAGTMLSQTTHAITIRARGDITPACFVTHTDEFGITHKFTIDYIRPPLKDRLMMLYVREEI